jgi:hypothetical protein
MSHLPFLRDRCGGEGSSLVLGKRGAHPFSPLYRVSARARAAHMYVLGITGKGKSKLLEHCICQDIAAGRGCVLIDPHSDLVTDTLRNLLSQGLLTPEDADRVIYFDPTHPAYTLPFNVLATEGNPYQITQRVVEAFRRTWPESLREAPQFSNIAQAALITLVENKLTLMDMDRVLTDRDWRERLLENVTYPKVVSFFRDRYEKWGREAPLMRESTLNKVAAFSFNPHLNRVLGQRENHLNLRAIMDEGKVLLVNLGRCEEETQRLLGSLLLTGLEQAAASRRDSPPEQRRPCYAYIDEFQDFSANAGSVKSLAKILSECRKFGLHLTLAHQNLSQLSPRMLGALGNIQTRVIFGVSRRDAEWFAREVGRVDTEAVKRDPKTETQHELFSPLLEQWETWIDRLRFQARRQATVSNPDGDVVIIKTITIPPYTATEDRLTKFQNASLRAHATPSSQAERNIRQAQQAERQLAPPSVPFYEVVTV